MKQTHVILRSAGWASRDILAGPALETSGQVDISVQIETLEQRDVAALQRDTGVVAVAPAMPMRLIAPRDIWASWVVFATCVIQNSSPLVATHSSISG